MSVHNGKFTFGTRLALVFIVESAFLSLFSVTSLLGIVVINSLRNRYRPPPGRPSWQFLRSPVDWYFLNMLISDLVQSIGNVLHIRWIGDGRLATGNYCTAQGILKQVGDVASALSILVIAGHTFLLLLFRWKAPISLLMPLGVIGVIWLFIILGVTIPLALNKNPPFYGPTTYWCWIEPEYRAEQIGLEYGILWFVALVGALLYTPVFLRLRGNLVIDFDTAPDGVSKGKMRVKWNWDATRSPRDRDREREMRRQLKIAKQMLAYPIAYIVLVLPISVTRWLIFTGRTVPAPAISFAGTVYAASGLVNCILYLITRPAVLRSLLSFLFGGNPNDIRQGAPTGRTIMSMPEVTMMSNSVASVPASPTAGYDMSLPGHNVPPPPPQNAGRMLDDDDDTDYGSLRDEEGTPAPIWSSVTPSASGHGHPRREGTTQTLSIPAQGPGLGYNRELGSTPGASHKSEFSHSHEGSWQSRN